MKRKHYLIGKRFGRLTVLKESEEKKYYWDCICDCGNKKAICGSNLIRGDITSCKCFRIEHLKSRRFRDDIDRSLYKIWLGMKTRCQNPKYKDYKHYGGRGIKIFNRWHNFDKFCQDMKDTYHNGLSLDRIDNSKHYCKSNCRWTTQKVQCNNQRKTIFIIFNDLKKPLTEWSKITGISAQSLRYRFHKGWPVEKLLSK